MKVLYIIPTLGPGGAESFVAMLATAMAALNVEVYIYLTVGVIGERGMYLANKLESAKVKIIRKKHRNPYSILNIFELALAMKRIEPDVVHAHLYNAEVICAVAAKLAKIPKNRRFRTLHNTDIVGSGNRWLVQKLEKEYGASIACSSAVASAYQKFSENIHSLKMHIILNGISDPSTNEAKDTASARKKLDISEDCFVIISVASFRGSCLSTSPKAHDTMILAFKEFLQFNVNSLLLLVGDGPLMVDACDLVNKLGIHDSVRFLGSISDPQEMLALSDVFFMPSRNEGLPISLLEAGVNGLPVVASKINEITDLDFGYPWYYAEVDNISEFCESLKQSFINREIVDVKYASSVRARFGIENSAKRHYSTYVSQSR